MAGEDGTARAYGELPDHVREFLEHLRPEDIASISEGIALAKAAKTMGKFWRWTFIFIVSAFAGMATIGQAYDWLRHRIFGGGAG